MEQNPYGLSGKTIDEIRDAFENSFSKRANFLYERRFKLYYIETLFEAMISALNDGKDLLLVLAEMARIDKQSKIDFRKNNPGFRVNYKRFDTRLTVTQAFSDGLHLIKNQNEFDKLSLMLREINECFGFSYQEETDYENCLKIGLFRILRVSEGLFCFLIPASEHAEYLTNSYLLTLVFSLELEEVASQ